MLRKLVRLVVELLCDCFSTFLTAWKLSEMAGELHESLHFLAGIERV
jgi:hypothetical protein